MALDHAAATGAAPVPSAPSRGLRHAFRALRHRDFALFLTGATPGATPVSC